MSDDEELVFRRNHLGITIGPKGWVDCWQYWARCRFYDKSMPFNHVHYYRMPRQAGTTSFLIDIANEMHDDEKKVTFLVPHAINKCIVKEHLRDGVEVLVINDAYDLRGLSSDVWIGDCVYEKLLKDADLTPLSGKHIYIDSVW